MFCFLLTRTAAVVPLVLATAATIIDASVAFADSAELNFAPASLSIDAGGHFAIDVVVTTDVPTRGLQFGLKYDPALIQVDELRDGSFYSDWARAHGAQAATPIHFTPNNTTGHVSIGGMALFGASWEGPQGTGPVLRISGTAKPGASGTATLVFESPWVTSARGAPIRPLSVGTAAVGVNMPPAVEPKVETVPTGRVHLPEPGITAEVDPTGLQSTAMDRFMAWVRVQLAYLPLGALLVGLCTLVIVYRLVMSVPVKNPTAQSPSPAPTNPGGRSEDR